MFGRIASTTAGAWRAGRLERLGADDQADEEQDRHERQRAG